MTTERHLVALVSPVGSKQAEAQGRVPSAR